MTLRLVLCGCLILGCGKKQATDDETAPASDYSALELTNGGTVEGTVTASASAPQSVATIGISKDQDACGTTHPNVGAIVPPNVSGAIVYIERLPKGKPFEASHDVTIDQHQCEFVPHLSTVTPRSRIVMSNSDPALHNFHFMRRNESVMNEAQPPGAPPREVKLSKSGVYKVFCDVHPWMRGFVFVAQNPYYAVTGTDGKFSISNVPPGVYLLKVFRDNWNVEMPRSGERITEYKWGQSFEKEQTVTVAPHENATVNFVLP